MKYETKIHSLIIKPEGEPIFSELATIIGVDDEAAGVYLTIDQSTAGKIRIDMEEWPLISAGVDRMIAEWEKSGGTDKWA